MALVDQRASERRERGNAPAFSDAEVAALLTVTEATDFEHRRDHTVIRHLSREPVSDTVCSPGNRPGAGSDHEERSPSESVVKWCVAFANGRLARRYADRPTDQPTDLQECP